jgi:hypothetical protein
VIYLQKGYQIKGELADGPMFDDLMIRCFDASVVYGFGASRKPPHINLYNIIISLGLLKWL